ncbi:MAG: hypothetical protein FWF80_05740 [Defluviitaleaceae bacterium]|nr:hypothetical protein [Defluviitaleaceae bacterium]
MTLKDVFESTRSGGNFSLHMSEFAQCFLEDAYSYMVADEPTFYPEIALDNYVYAACFVHYWCDVFLMKPPEWVFSKKYMHPFPKYSFEEMRDELERVTPHQFKQRNLFMRRMEVVYV